jgi:hypothetical protein
MSAWIVPTLWWIGVGWLAREIRRNESQGPLRA